MIPSGAAAMPDRGGALDPCNGGHLSIQGHLADGIDIGDVQRTARQCDPARIGKAGFASHPVFRWAARQIVSPECMPNGSHFPASVKTVRSV